MSYGVAAEIMRALGISGSRFDTIISEYMAKASEYIDNMLRPWVAVPLTTVPNVIHDIANDLAVGMYREDRLGSTGQPVQTDAASKRAREALNAYIAGQYEGGGAGQGTKRKDLFRKVYYGTGDEDGGVNL